MASPRGVVAGHVLRRAAVLVGIVARGEHGACDVVQELRRGLVGGPGAVRDVTRAHQDVAPTAAARRRHVDRVGHRSPWPRGVAGCERHAVVAGRREGVRRVLDGRRVLCSRPRIAEVPRPARRAVRRLVGERDGQRSGPTRRGGAERADRGGRRRCPATVDDELRPVRRRIAAVDDEAVGTGSLETERHEVARDDSVRRERDIDVGVERRRCGRRDRGTGDRGRVRVVDGRL